MKNSKFFKILLTTLFVFVTTNSIAKTIKTGMDIIGVDTPEKM